MVKDEQGYLLLVCQMGTVSFLVFSLYSLFNSHVLKIVALIVQFLVS